MEIKNLTGLEKPLVKLIETVGTAMSPVGNHWFNFDAAKIKRIGTAQAEVTKNSIIAEAEAQAEKLEILDRAKNRVACEQYEKQINLEKIINKTRDDLHGSTVSDEIVEKDWIMKFFDTAQNVSREMVQNILAKILSGEIQKPGSFSYKVLDIIKYISQKNLQTFMKFVAISTDNGILRLANNENGSLKKYNLSFQNYLDLADIGLFNQSSMISLITEINLYNKINFQIGNNKFVVENEEKDNIKILRFELYAFSRAGKEIRALILNQSKNDKLGEYISDFLEQVKHQGLSTAKLT